MDAHGSNVHQLTDHPGSDGWPVFSPDGQIILFVSNRNNSYDLYAMNTDGTDVTQLTDTPEYENYPVYSPDGKKIAFISKNGKEFEICIMNSDGTQRRTLVPQQWIVDDTFIDSYGVLVWSPDGKELAFTCTDLVVMVSVPGSGIDLTWVMLAGLLLAGCVYLFFRYKNLAFQKNLEK
jgi:TolB protein